MTEILLQVPVRSWQVGKIVIPNFFSGNFGALVVTFMLHNGYKYIQVLLSSNSIRFEMLLVMTIGILLWCSSEN